MSLTSNSWAVGRLKHKSRNCNIGSSSGSIDSSTCLSNDNGRSSNGCNRSSSSSSNRSGGGGDGGDALRVRIVCVC